MLPTGLTKAAAGWWQDVKIGREPVPIESDEGWLIFYHRVVGTCNGLVYSMGAAILEPVTLSKVSCTGRQFFRPRSNILHLG